MTDERNKVDIWGGTVLTVANRHIKGCGKPPDLKADGAYTAYFENDYGEQLVFQYDSEQKKGTLWHGDYSWEDPVEVMAGGTTLIISRDERFWLALVWDVATKYESREFHVRSALALNQAHLGVIEELLAHRDFQDTDSFRQSFIKQRDRLHREEKKLGKKLVEAQIEDATESA